MMTLVEMMRTLEGYGDISVWTKTTEKGLVYDITVEDFLGFDDDWSEMFREYVDEELLDEFLDALGEQALSKEGDFYYTYYFEDFTVQLDFASYDI